MAQSLASKSAPQNSVSTDSRFWLGRYSLLTLVYCLPVVAFGAFVRATHSGDGCGSHWPDCHGEILPLSAPVETIIEFSHRMSSGLIGIMVAVLFLWSYRITPRRDPIRKAALATLLFTILEALIGAVLVRQGLVDRDQSSARAIVMSIHLTNTFFLLASMTLLAWRTTGLPRFRFRGQGSVGWVLGLALLANLLLGISGAITALGDTITRGASAAEAAKMDLAPLTRLMVELRLLHPLIATSIGVFMMLGLGFILHLRPDPRLKKWVRWTLGLYAAQMLVGLINVWLKAPAWMQVVHLIFADLIWIGLILTCLSACAEGVSMRNTSILDSETEPNGAPSTEPARELVTQQTGEPHSPRTWRTLVKAYIVLTKPRVISLLLFTTLAAMFIAARGWPGGWLLLAVALGGYCSAGAANAFNMVIDRDIDVRMKRTSKRPTVTAEIPTAHALIFGFALMSVGFGLLWGAANLLAALMAMAGLAFYVFIYTLMLKRRTWQNIVIGGAAGAFPPLVGYSAVTGNLSPLAWILFGIIFLWTPVHFWALALMIKEDYAEAGVPMLPVVRGERTTVVQITLYAVLTGLFCILPIFQKDGLGMPYLLSALVLNGLLIARSWSLMQHTDRPHALKLYKYSMVYLALLFLMIAVDRAMSI